MVDLKRLEEVARSSSELVIDNVEGGRVSSNHLIHPDFLSFLEIMAACHNIRNGYESEEDIDKSLIEKGFELHKKHSKVHPDKDPSENPFEQFAKKMRQ